METSKSYLTKIKNYLHSKLYRKYLITNDMNNSFLVEKIIFNEKCRLVAVFKEFLIFEDDFEFLKKYYKINSIIKKLKLFLEYYEKYSILFPNYSILPESKYIYKNIHKKQKMIQNMQLKEEKTIKKNEKLEKKKINDEDNNKDIFNSSIYNSILKCSENDCISIFDLSKKENKDEDNMSISLINDIIRHIDNNEKEKSRSKNNFKIKYEYKIKPINIINRNKIRKFKYKIKGNTTNTTTNNSLNTNKSNTFKNNNSINDNNITITISQGNNIEKKILKDNNYHKFKLNIINNIKKNTIFPLNFASSAKNSIISYKKLNKFKSIKKIDKKNIDKNIITQINNDSSIIFNKNKNKKNINNNNVIKINENKYKADIHKDGYKINEKNKFQSESRNRLIDLKKSVSEKKLYKNYIKKQMLKNINNYNNNKINLKNLVINNKRKFDNIERFTIKKILTKSTFSLNKTKKKYNTYSNSKRKTEQVSKENSYNNLYKNKYNYNMDYNTSSSIRNIKSRLKNINAINCKTINISNKKKGKIINKNIDKGKILLTPNSSIQKDENKKKLVIKKNSIKKRNKLVLKLLFNNSEKYEISFKKKNFNNNLLKNYNNYTNENIKKNSNTYSLSKNETIENKK